MCAVYATVSVTRLLAHKAGPDLAIFDQAIRQYARFHPPYVTLKSVKPFNLLGDHFSPAMALFAPIFRIAPSVLTLLIVQAILLAVAVGIIQYAATAHGLPRPVTTAVTFSYGLSVGMVEAVNYDFHEVSVTVPTLAIALSLLLRGSTKAGTVVLLCTLLMREDNALIVIGVGLTYLVARRWMLGLGLAAIGTVAFALLTTVIIPIFSFSGHYTYFSTTGVGGSLAQTGRTVLRTLSDSLQPEMGPKTVLVLLLSFLFLPLGSKWIFPAAVLLGLRLTNPNPAYWVLGYHYNSIISTILAIAAVDTLTRLHRLGWISTRSRSRLLVACLSFAALLVSATGSLGKYANPVTYTCDRCQSLNTVIAMIPSGESVAADNLIVALTVDRNETYLAAPGLLDSVGKPIHPQWVLLDLHSQSRSDNPEWSRALWKQLTDADNYRLETSTIDGYILLRRY